MNLCSTLWQSYDALKNAYAEAEKFLNEGGKFSLSEYQKVLEKLSKAKQNYDESFFTTLPDGRKINTLDYISLYSLCEVNGLDFDEILIKQTDEFLIDGRVIRLGLSNTEVSDLSSITGITELQHLNCRATNVSDLTALKGLNKLKSVMFSNTEVSDLAPLSGLTNLEEIFCFYTKVSDLTPLAKLINLKRLLCSNTQVSDLSPLKALSMLQSINCSDTGVSDLTPLAKHINLTRLLCFNTQVSDLSPLKTLSNLRSINCSETGVTDLTPLSGLRIQNVNAGNNQLNSGSKNLAEERGWDI